jgi:hypothetical protein
MSKKNRKDRRPNVPTQTTPVQSAETKAGGGMIKMPSRGQSGTETINADYTHVYSDLRRIGLLAGLLIAGLVALSFFIK